MTRSVRLSMMLLIALALNAFSTDAQENAPVQSDSLELLQLARDWAGALKSKDAKELDRIMADDFITTNVDGSVNTKAQEIAPFRAPDLVFDTASLSELSVTMYATMAIVRGVGVFAGRSKWGQFASTERFTDVFLKRNGVWRAVSSHSSAMRKKKQ